MYLLEIEPLDLGEDVRAMGVELTEADENREPIRGSEAARIWSRVLRAVAGDEPWSLDFFSHLDPLRDYCERHQINFREASKRSIVIPAPDAEKLEPLIDRFQKETFGARAGELLVKGDSELEGIHLEAKKTNFLANSLFFSYTLMLLIISPFFLFINVF